MRHAVKGLHTSPEPEQPALGVYTIGMKHNHEIRAEHQALHVPTPVKIR